MEWVDDVCMRCKYYTIADGCIVFDGEVPDEVNISNKHDKILKGQKYKVVFEEIKGENYMSKDVMPKELIERLEILKIK